MPLYLVKTGKKRLLFANIEQKGYFGQFIGLMFRATFSTPLLFNGNDRIVIHSFFCPEFDAVFLNKQRRIVKLVKVKPWTPKIAASAVFLFECPAGTIEKFKLRNGSELQWTAK